MEPTTSKESESMLRLSASFRLESSVEIRTCAHRAVAGRQLIAMVTSSGDLLVYHSNPKYSLPVMRQVPWHIDEGKQITALCFDPWGTWLAEISDDSTLYIIPVTSLVDPAMGGRKWPTHDITSYPSKERKERPCCMVWWQTTLYKEQICVIGYEFGLISFVDLTTGKESGVIQMSVSISQVHLVMDNRQDSVSLLITGSNQEQWRLLLEQQSKQYRRPFHHECSSRQVQSLLANGRSSVIQSSVRTRLQGLKQMSTEKLATLRQKLAETRKGKNVRLSDIKCDTSIDENGQRNSLEESTLKCSMCPENLMSYVGETFVQPQFIRTQHVYSGYYAPSNVLTVHNSDYDIVPLSVHRLPPKCHHILMTDNLIYVTIQNLQRLIVVSSFLSNSKLEDVTSYDPSSVLQEFLFPDGEHILSTFKKTTPVISSNRISQENSSEAQLNRRNLVAVMSVPVYEKTASASREQIADMKKKASLSFHNDLGTMNYDIDLPNVIEDKAQESIEDCISQDCVVVTSKGLYEIKLRHSPPDLYLENILQQKYEQAERIGCMFSLNTSQLLEVAGNQKLQERDFTQAISLYRMSKCRHLKSVLRFATAGCVSELLTYIHVLFTTAGVELSIPDRVHISNLGMLCFIEQLLRGNVARAVLLKQFLKYIEENNYYDEVLAVKILGQMGLWDAVHFISFERGIFVEMLDILLRVIHSFKNDMENKPFKIKDGVTLCLSEPALRHALLTNPPATRFHLQVVQQYVKEFDQSILERLAELYDPSHHAAQSTLKRFFWAMRYRQCSINSISSIDSEIMDFVEDEEDLIPMDEMVETFILILLSLVECRGKKGFDSELIQYAFKPKPVQLKSDSVPASGQSGQLVAGFSHCCLVRNSTLYLWGQNAAGCLGLGPFTARFSTPRSVRLFPALKVKVLSVACGKQHTLATTTNGVYAWGSSKYGQLGIGRVGRRPRPELVIALAGVQVKTLACGQFHSIAVTTEGRMYTWGWGVHGQLGHKSVECMPYPTPVRRMGNKVVTSATGGYAHTVVCTSNGEVYGFGCNLFGQLGTGNVKKCSAPIRIAVCEKIKFVTSGYFHNVGLSTSNKIYIWGCSPQSLRLQAQSQKTRNSNNNRPAPETTMTTEPKVTKQLSKESILSPTASSVGIVLTPCSPNDDSKEVGQSLHLNNSCSHSNQEPPVDMEAHLTAKEVDTSHIGGDIVQVSCGSHHSALLTAEGTVYVWGRNLDGQLGMGSWKEVIVPTAISGLANIYIMQISCGSDFTLAMEAGGKVWGWGNNSHAELGRSPVEDKPSDTKIVMLKTSKRTIKLHHNTQNIFDTPQEICGIPCLTIDTDTSNIDSMPKGPGAKEVRMKIQNQPNFKTADTPSYGCRALHLALEYFHGCYGSGKILTKCLEIKNYQAAAKLSALEGHFHQGVYYQLQTLEDHNKVDSTTNTDENDKYLTQHACHILDFHFSLMDAENFARVSKMLQKAFDFWLDHYLPMSPLEDVLTKHMSCLFWPLSLLICSSEKECSNNEESSDPPDLICRLSTHFLLHLCSTVLAHNAQQSQCRPEVKDLLSLVTKSIVSRDDFDLSNPLSDQSLRKTLKALGFGTNLEDSPRHRTEVSIALQNFPLPLTEVTTPPRNNSDNDSSSDDVKIYPLSPQTESSQSDFDTCDLSPLTESVDYWNEVGAGR